jgi:hypothetical protein
VPKSDGVRDSGLTTDGCGWPCGCWGGFLTSYCYFFVGVMTRPRFHLWGTLFAPMLVFSSALLFNTIGLVSGLFRREDAGKELLLGYLRSVGALCLVFAPLVVVAWYTWGRTH